MNEKLGRLLEDINEEIKKAEKAVGDELIDVAENFKRIANGVYSEVYHITGNSIIEQETRWLEEKIRRVADLRKSKEVVLQCIFELQSK